MVWNELFLKQAHIGAWKSLVNRDAIDVERPRKILLPRKKSSTMARNWKKDDIHFLLSDLFQRESYKSRSMTCKREEAASKEANSQGENPR